MTITLILVLCGVLSLVFLLRLAKGAHPDLDGVEELTGRIRPVDIEAFRNLIDPGEEEFLRANLAPADFRKVQRERLRAAMEYIVCAARNAAILVRMGEAARLSSDPAIAEAGTQLVDSAIRLRLYSFQALAKLYVGFLLPFAHVHSNVVAERYERITGLATLLGRLQAPPRGVSAVL